MRNSALIVIAAFLTILAGGYSVLWYAQALSIQNHIESQLQSINTPTTYITYTSLDIAGFPRDIEIHLRDPRFQGRVDQLLQSLTADDPSHPFAKLRPWQLDTTLHGELMVTVNAWSNRYSMIASGVSDITSTVDGQSRAARAELAGSKRCYLELQRASGLFSTLWDFSRLSGDKEAFAEMIHTLDCSSPAFNVKDTATGDLLMSGDGNRLYFSSEPSVQGQQKGRIYLQLKDMEITPAGDRWLQPATGDAADAHSRYGKTNLLADIGYDGNPMQRSVHLAVQSLAFSNALYGISAQGNMQFASNSPIPAGELTLLCDHCPALVDDVTAASARPAPLSPQAVDRFKQFLSRLNDAQDTAERYHYRIVSQNGNLTVNGHPFLELIQMYNELMKPQSPPPAP